MQSMPHDRFEDRLRAFAEQLSRSLSETDLDEVADRLGVDRDRVQGAAGAVGDWLNDQAAARDPLFGATVPTPRRDAGPVSKPAVGRSTAGPHPLDLPADGQGRALSALSSGRWTLQPGSSSLSGTGTGPEPPEDADLIGELRARDWIIADGSVTLVGRQALLRWCDTAERASGEDAGGAPAGEAPEPSA